MLAQLTDPEILVSLLALSALEIVLGIDNIVFIAIMVQRLEESKRQLAYRLGIGAALVSRLLLLFSLAWILKLTAPLFTVVGKSFSGRDLILLGGGMFLLVKSTQEIFEKVEGREHSKDPSKGSATMRGVVTQIMIIDIIFSLDSVITAVGIAKEIWVMVVAMVSAVLVMLVFAERVGKFVTRHPSLQVLALSFLLLIGVLLVAEGFGQHVSKGYVYFAMSFSLLVELVNMRRRAKASHGAPPQAHFDAVPPPVG